MAVFCNYCGKEIVFPEIFTCSYCYAPFCIEHRLIEDHKCKTAKSKKSIKKSHPTTTGDTKWMYDCLRIAKDVINKHHENRAELFAQVKFDLFIQKELKAAFVSLGGSFPNFHIGIHESLSLETPENTRMIVIILIHQILHTIHPDWLHRKIEAEEKSIANKAGYFDSLRNMQVLYLSGKMRLCEK